MPWVGRINSIEAFLFLSLLAGGAVFTDLWRKKIYNWMTLPSLFLGVFWLTWHFGWRGLGDSLLGILVGLICFGALFLVGWLGAGDVKLLMAFGAWGGAAYAWNVTVSSLCFGALMALIVMVVTGRLFGFMRRCFFYLRSVFVPGLEVERLQLDSSFQLPFAIPIAAAAITEAFGVSIRSWYG